PAIGDLAAEALVQRWAQPHLFDIYAPLSVRQRQRIELKNIWLKKHDREPLPVPARRKVEPASESTVRPLLQAVRDAKTAESRRGALAAVKKLGLPALLAMSGLLRDMNPTDPAHDDLRAAAQEIALTVAEARFSTDSIKPGLELKKQVEGLQGKPITKTAFLS